MRKVSDLPRNARRYLRRIEESIHTKIVMVSVGEERNETIVMKHPFAEARQVKSRSGKGKGKK